MVGAACDVVGSQMSLRGQSLHFIGDDAEYRAIFTGTAGLDRGIQRQHSGCLGNLIDALRTAAHVFHRVRYCIDMRCQILDKHDDVTKKSDRTGDDFGTGLQPSRCLFGRPANLIDHITEG